MQLQLSPTRLIPLSQELWALVDAADYPALSQFKWSARRRKLREEKFDAVRGLGSARKPGHKIVRMHRQLMGCEVGVGVEVDHVNGDSLDNRRSNLRLATSGQQKHNRGRYRNNTSGFIGVSFHKTRGLWRARIMVDYREKTIGRYATAEQAARAYDAAAIKLHGDFARVNFPSHAATGAD